MHQLERALNWVVAKTNVSLFILPPALIDVEGAGNLVVVTPVPPGTFAEQLRVFSTSQATDGPEIGLPMSGVQLATGGISTAVPEPATWAMMLLGFAGLGFMAYRRKNKVALSAA
jgi:hypothetical protein